MKGHLSQECLRILNLLGRKEEEPNLGRQPLTRAPNPQESETSLQKGQGRLSQERLKPQFKTILKPNEQQSQRRYTLGKTAQGSRRRTKTPPCRSPPLKCRRTVPTKGQPREWSEPSTG
uniref:Uncharacterized protein n=1 Tax=Knipowitschia caucasica TaxID=637954 RepID=A0AAV2LKJ3_KNICA